MAKRRSTPPKWAPPSSRTSPSQRRHRTAPAFGRLPQAPNIQRSTSNVERRTSNVERSSPADHRAMQRNRLAYAFLIALVIGAGLASRSRLANHLPDFIATYSGDTLWAFMVFLMVGLVFPKLRTPWVMALAIGFAFSVEFSQLHQGDWINRIRATRPGALVLGAGFLWSDLVCYTVGILIGAAGEALRPSLRANKTAR